MRFDVVKHGLHAIGRPLAVLFVAFTVCMTAAWMYFSAQTSALQRQMEHGRFQLQQADGILRSGPHVLDEMRAMARTDEVFRVILRANEFPLEPQPFREPKP